MIGIIYYAHSMTMYNTEREQEELRLLESFFPYKLIYNPNRRSIQHAKEPMQTCLEIIKDSSIEGVAFSGTRDFISSGVYFELKVAGKRQLPLYRIYEDEIQQFCGSFIVVGKDRKQKWARVQDASDNS